MLYQTLSLASLALLASAAPVPSTAQVSGPGILLKNVGTLTTPYCFFNNLWNGDGTAGPNYDNPDTCVSLAPGASQFVPLESTFKGRVQRGKAQPATWVEFQLSAANDGKAHGDVSVEAGNDGPATLESLDSGYPTGGFTKELVPGAPASAKTTRPSDGQEVIASTMGNWLAPANNDAVTYTQGLIDPSLTYVQGGTGVQDIASSKNAFTVTFY